MRFPSIQQGSIVIKSAPHQYLNAQPLVVVEKSPPSVCTRLSHYCVLLKQCVKTQDLVQGRVLHHHLIKNGSIQNLVIMNFLIDLYGNCGSMPDALHGFWRMQEKNVFSWTILISVCIKHCQNTLGLQLFFQMQMEGVTADRFTYSLILGAFRDGDGLAQGKRLHACIIATEFYEEVIILTAIINMYSKCGSPQVARAAFDAIHSGDVMAWNTMIAGYSNHGYPAEALELYHKMRHSGVTPNETTFTSILQACSTPDNLEVGKGIHADINNGGFTSSFVRTALISMYSDCRALELAEGVFHEYHQHDVVSMTVMIGAYVKHERGKDAINLFGQMLKMGIEPTCPTFVNILSAFSLLGSAEGGKKLYMFAVEKDLESDGNLATAIVCLYGKCGTLADALEAFGRITSRDVIAWNAIMAAYAQNGDDKTVLEFFEKMQQDGVKPDSASYVSALSACSHSGSLEEAREYFGVMQSFHGIEPNNKHCACMIDLLGRASLLDEAEKLIRKMPVEPDTVVLMAFLGACKVRGDRARGKWAAERLMELDPHLGTPYIALYNCYAAEGQ